VPVTLATLEARVRRITVEGQSKQKIMETPSEPIAGCGGVRLSSQVTQKAEIEWIIVPGLPGQKVCKTPS
jgi:hypothetical protein